MISALIAAGLGFLFTRMWRSEPRRLRNGVVFLLAAYFAVSAVVETVTMMIPGTGYIVFLVIILLPFSVLALCGILVRNGLQMFRREGRSLGNSLSLLAGLALLAAPAIALALVFTGAPVAIAAAMLLFLVCAHLGVAFLVFFTFARLYARRSPRPGPDAVVVLGSRLIRGGVPPLLRARLDRGRSEFDRLTHRTESADPEAPEDRDRSIAEAGADRVSAEPMTTAPRPCFLVTTGGQGADEPQPEGTAMAEYLREAGVPAEAVLEEDRARTTEENLLFSRALVDSRVATGGHLLVVTNGYHVPRAALLSRDVGVDADAVGARTARYFVPSAFLREFVAVMVMHRVLNIVLLLPSGLAAALAGWLLWSL